MQPRATPDFPLSSGKNTHPKKCGRVSLNISKKEAEKKGILIKGFLKGALKRKEGSLKESLPKRLQGCLH